MSRPVNVLIVEDSEDDAKLMALALRRHDFAPTTERVETAEDLEGALDRQPWDVILADYNLPAFSAPRALEIVQRRQLDIPFILVSGTVGDERAVAAMKAGAHDFVLKQSLFRLGPAVARELREAEERRERRKAEAALVLLADISQLLIEAPDWKLVLGAAVERTVPALADWCILYASCGSAPMDTIDIGLAEGVDEEALKRLAHDYRPAFPPQGERGPIAETLRTRKGAVTAVDERTIAAMSHDEQHAALWATLRPQSLMTLPLLVRDRLTGIWILAMTGPRRFVEADLALGQEIAYRLALVAENARLSWAREEFLSTAIHEIKTPVAAIKIAVQLARRAPDEIRGEKLDQLLARIERQSNRLTRLVANVIEISRMEGDRMAIAPRPVRIGQLVEDVVREMNGASGNHTIAVSIRDDLVVDADSDRIAQVLTNLLDNAIKYSPDGGRVEIEVRREGDEAVVSVRDHGVGIPAERQDRIFERFFRAHAGTPYGHATSMGVGLYLSREFVIRHGGRMWFESREGHGSTFSFSLPLTASRQEVVE